MGHPPFMDRLQNGLFVGGLSILIVFVASWLALSKAHYHTGLRDAAIGASDAACLLVLLWVLVAGVFAFRYWRATSVRFRVALVLNAAAVVFLIVDFLRFR